MYLHDCDKECKIETCVRDGWQCRSQVILSYGVESYSYSCRNDCTKSNGVQCCTTDLCNKPPHCPTPTPGNSTQTINSGSAIRIPSLYPTPALHNATPMVNSATPKISRDQNPQGILRCGAERVEGMIVSVVTVLLCLILV